MSKDNERSDYHHNSRLDKKDQEFKVQQQNLIDRLRGNSHSDRPEKDTSQTSVLHRDESEPDARSRMERKEIGVRAEISKCRDLRQELIDDLSRRLGDIDLTLPAAATRLNALAKEVGETAQEKYDLYFRGLKTSTAIDLRENLWSIRRALLGLADEASEYQINFPHQD